MADTGLPAAGLEDWQCYCDYVNTGLDTTCARCGLTQLESIAQFEQAALAKQARAAEEQIRQASRRQPAGTDVAQALAASGTGAEKVALQFDGRGLDLLGLLIVVSLLSMITLGIYGFWGQVRIMRWLVNHFRLYGRRLDFTGTGLDFLGIVLLNWLLCAITLGIYTPWAFVNLTQWYQGQIVYAASPTPST